MKKNKIIIHWFRQDLRLSDNPALSMASSLGQVMPIYILDDINSRKFSMGAASRWWLHHCLIDLNKNLNNKLNIYIGDPQEVLLKLVKQHDVASITWNRCYEPWRITRDTKLKKVLKQNQIEVHSDNGSLLWEPWEITKKDGGNYKVFTPFYQKGCLQAEPCLTPREPLAKPRNLDLIKDTKYSKKISDLNFLPNIKWYKTMDQTWNISEEGAKNRLNSFLKNGIDNYKIGRDFPAAKSTSRLSPYLHFGQISPNQIWYGAKRTANNDNNLKCFLSELGWREFSYNLLYFYPDLPRHNLRQNFDKFPWNSGSKSKKLLRQWQQGQTGYPIIDAGIRELWQTGYMHNRVRMIVASFLVKNLLIDWREGEQWFWDCLVDADLASNSASWQWVAGSGADAAPYFRIFNPVLQGQKFDPDGVYTKKYVPELAKLNIKYLFNPFDAPNIELEKAGIVLGQSYPEPIVDIKMSRQAALDAYNKIK